MAATSLAIDLPPELIETIVELVIERIAEDQVPVEDGWLTVAEAADYLRCPKSRIYGLVSARRIPFEKDGSRTLFRRSKLDAWLQDGGGRRP
jgi:excisionase family DNA binding protein